MEHKSRGALTFLSVECRACSLPISVDVPRQLTIQTNASGIKVTQLPPIPEYGEVGLCVPCRLAALSEAEAAAAENDYQNYLTEAAAADMPGRATIIPILFASGQSAPQKFRGLRIRLLGVQAVDLPTIGTFCTLGFTDAEGAVAVLVVYRVVIQHDSTEVALVRHVGPGHDLGWLDVHAIDRLEHISQWTALGYGLEFFTALTSPAGRPSDCVKRIRAFIRQFKGLSAPSRAETARFLYGDDPAQARDSLNKCLKRAREQSGITFSDLVMEEFSPTD